MISNKLTIWVLIFCSLFFGFFSAAGAKTDGIDVNLHIGSCNNNGICEAGNEDFFVCPADCTPVVVPADPLKRSSGGLAMNNVFNNLRVEVTYDSAIISWTSVIPVMSNIKWGTTSDYKDGVIKNINYLLNHKIEINNLKDGTLYYFNIEAANMLGKTSTLSDQIFLTLTRPDTTPPGNPTELVATSENNGLTISWKNPTDSDFDYTRVMRNTDRYYSNPNQGQLVYEGRGNYFTDGKILEKNKYYYSFFSRDRAGNYSSGSLISVIYNPKAVDLWGQVLTPSPTVKENESRVIITQGNKVQDFVMNQTYHLAQNEAIAIEATYQSQNKNDDLWIEIKNSDKKIEGQYLLKRAVDNSKLWTVKIPPFVQGGDYYIYLNRYQNNLPEIIRQGIFSISPVAGESEVLPVTENSLGWWILFIAIIIIILLFLYFRSSRNLKRQSR